jgi:hypothetical protein
MGTAVVAFRSDGPWQDRAVRDVLSNCSDYVTERVVKRGKPFFERKA